MSAARPDSPTGGARRLPDLQDHLHRALAQLVRVFPLCRHDSASSQDQNLQDPGVIQT
jgi:hypothetical protein